jgi:hypothetical protein
MGLITDHRYLLFLPELSSKMNRFEGIDRIDLKKGWPRGKDNHPWSSWRRGYRSCR